MTRGTALGYKELAEVRPWPAADGREYQSLARRLAYYITSR
jgi:hypothetical protein